MGLMPIAEHGKCVEDTGALPLYYMNDYSILGLSVPDLDAALSALEADGFEILANTTPTRVRFDSRQNMTGIFETLSRHRIAYRMADLVSHAYQG